MCSGEQCFDQCWPASDQVLSLQVPGGHCPGCNIRQTEAISSVDSEHPRKLPDRETPGGSSCRSTLRRKDARSVHRARSSLPSPRVFERETYANELLGRLDGLIADRRRQRCTPRPELADRKKPRSAPPGDQANRRFEGAKYLPVLQRWKKSASRRMAAPSRGRSCAERSQRQKLTTGNGLFSRHATTIKSMLEPVLTGDFAINAPISHHLAQLAAALPDV